MTTVIGGSSPSITFSDSTTQSTAALPLTGGSLTGNITSTGSISSVNTFGFKNRIINGGMGIDQRNNGASITPTTTGTYSVDRWRCGLSVASKYSAQQSATAPTGFINSLLITSTSSYSVGSAETFNLTQYIEGYNIADLGWGTANASTVTLSFWVYSSLTGTFAGSLRNNNLDRAYPFTYSISSSNTWTKISLTIAGDTTGTWATNNNAGIAVTFSLGSGSTYNGTAGTWQSGNLLSVSGSVSVVGTNAATWYITGVQLEVGSTATSFDYRPYGTELQLCQRYYMRWQNPNSSYNTPLTSGTFFTTTSVYAPIPFQVSMRTAPSWVYSALSDIVLYTNNASFSLSSFNIANEITTVNAELNLTTSSSSTAGYACFVRVSAGSGKFLAASAEL
jgi:hypothetical protein